MRISRLCAVLVAAALPVMALGQKAPQPSVQQVTVVNQTTPVPVTGSVNVANTPSVDVPSGVTVNNTSINPIPVIMDPASGSLGNVTVMNTPLPVTASPANPVTVTGSVGVAGTASVNVTNGSIPVSGSVAIDGTPTVSVPGGVAVTNTPYVSVANWPSSSSGSSRFSILAECEDPPPSDGCTAQGLVVPTGKVFVVERLSGFTNATGTPIDPNEEVYAYLMFGTLPWNTAFCGAPKKLGTWRLSVCDVQGPFNLPSAFQVIISWVNTTPATTRMRVYLHGYLVDAPP